MRVRGSQELASACDGDAGPSVELSRFVDSAKVYAGAAKSEATIRAYRGDWVRFESFCRTCRASSLPASPEVVAAYVAHLADLGRRPSSIERALVSVSQGHKLAGYTPSPTSSAPVRETLKGIKRRLGTAPTQKSPLLVKHLIRICELLPDTLLGLRNQSMLLLGFASAMRRSELVSLDVRDLEEAPEGLVVTLRRSKTDQEGASCRIAVPFGVRESTCPVRTLRDWLSASEITSGPVFRPMSRGGRVLEGRLSDRAVARIVKSAVEAAGYDPSRFSGHSLRAGVITEAARADVPEREIMKHTRHTTERMVRRYIRDGELFTHCAAKGLL